MNKILSLVVAAMLTGVASTPWDPTEKVFQQPYGPAVLLFVRGDRVIAAGKDYARLRPLADDRVTAVIAEIQRMAKESRK
jgi:hypothetical protein